ncbi:MAG TPA: hypothetical protein VE862_05300, partial [Candidatus Acidoferrum sp.]|nr:hypothetical protein [Candidatus Acidoferrum sp.]
MNRRQAERLKARLEKSLTDLDIETKANHARYASASPNELDAINLENLRLVAERKKVEGEHALCMIRLQQIAANEKRAKQLGEE